MRRLTALLVTTLATTGCGLDESGIEDGEQDAFTSADGKADGYDVDEAHALAVLSLAGSLTEAQLRDEAGVTSRIAKNIVAYRKGKDGRAGTKDDQTFDSLAELDAIPYLGPRALEQLVAYAGSREGFDADALGRHDVSILVPLPRSGDLPWKAATPGNGGALLPRSVFDKIPVSVFRDLADGDAEYNALRVVGVRFDPCFTTSLTSACQPQVRLVFQALHPETGTHDGAIHALYNLSASQHADAVAKLRALEAKAPQNRAYAPLGVSPALAAQGMSGAYARGLGELITSLAGPATLARMTFVTRTLARQGQWELGGFHVKANAATGFPAAGRIQIEGADLQIINNAGFGGHRYTISPTIADANGRPGLDSYAIGVMTSAQRTKIDAWARTQHSPLAVVPDTTDCASCHVAGHVSNALAAAEPRFAVVDGGPRAIGEAEQGGDNLRAFGYFDEAPMISIRTANETAAVLRAFATP